MRLNPNESESLWHSQHGQDRWIIEEIFPRLRDGFFVDLGAYDGKTWSNTYALEKDFGWTGLCIDPFQSESLRRNRECLISDALISSLEKEFEVLIYKEGSGILETLSNPMGVNKELRDFALREGFARIERKRSKTLASVFKSFQVPKVIHYLSLDVEGHELEILKDFPFFQYQILALTVEHNRSQGNRDAVRGLLQAQGFKLAFEDSIEDRFVHHSKT